MTDIRDTKIYNNFIAKFDQHITIDKNGNKISMYPPPQGWQKLKKDITTRNAKNVAILTGKFNGFIGLDLDIEKNGKKSGMEWFELNFGKIEDQNTLITKSIRGGRHLFYEYSKEIHGKIGVVDGYNVDIKTDGGFLYEGIEYDLLKDVDELQSPNFLVEYFKNKNEVETFEKETKFNCELEGKYEIVYEILNIIGDASEYYKIYESWIRIMMALKNIGAKCELFYQLTEEFGTPNKRNEMKYQWEHYTPVKKGDRNYVGIGTILYYLKKSVEPAMYKDLLNSLYEEKVEIIKPEGIKYSREYLSKVFKKKDKNYEKDIINYANNHFGYVYEPQAYLFRQYENKQYILTKNLDHYIDRKILNIWLNSDKKTEYTEIEFQVMEKNTNKDKYNLYIRPKTNFNNDKTLEQIAPLFCQFLKVIAGNEEMAYVYLINWFACLIQCGLTKQAIVLIGDKGIGKGTFGELCGLLIGNVYYRFLKDINHIGNKFNGDKEKTILTFIDEIAYDAGTYTKIQEMIKSMITDSRTRIEKKGIDPYFVDTYENLIFSTNEFNPVKIDKENRRFFVSNVSNELKNNTEFFHNLRKEFNDNLEDIRGYFFNFKYTKDLNSIRPITEAEKQLLEINRHPVELFLEEDTDEYSYEGHTQSNELGGIYVRYVWFCKENQFKILNKVYFSKYINKNGFETIRITKNNIKNRYVIKIQDQDKTETRPEEI